VSTKWCEFNLHLGKLYATKKYRFLSSVHIHPYLYKLKISKINNINNPIDYNVKSINYENNMLVITDNRDIAVDYVIVTRPSNIMYFSSAIILCITLYGIYISI